MLLKDRVCTFEEVQDRARVLLDGLIEKYLVGSQEQVSVFLFFVFYISLVDE
jgi:hypothetical protein